RHPSLTSCARSSAARSMSTRRPAASRAASDVGDEMTTILRLVSEGKLSAEEAAPIIEALGRPDRSQHLGPPQPPATPGSSKGRRIRIQVTERGRKAVDVRVPLAFAAMAAKMVPGIPESYRKLI